MDGGERRRVRRKGRTAGILSLVLDICMGIDDIYFLVVSSKTAGIGVFSESVAEI